MKYIVKNDRGKTVSNHRKWERAVDSASKHASETKRSATVYAKPKTGDRWVFSFANWRAKYHKHIVTGHVVTTFSEESVEIRYKVIDKMSRTPHN